jgi:hypothetical protein
MVKCLLQYHIDWLCAPTTKASEMACPECLAPLVVGGILNVVMPAREAGECFGKSPAIAVADIASVIDNGLMRDELDKTTPGDVLTEDQKTILQEGEIKKEQLRTSPPDMELPDGFRIIDEPVPTPNEPITTPFTSDGNPLPIEVIGGENIKEDDKIKLVIKTEPAFVCDVCGKECKNLIGLNSHKKSHKGGKQ